MPMSPKAKDVLNGSRRIAQNTPIQLEAARATEQQATARYKAGLGNITEVVEANGEMTYDQTRVARLSARVPGTLWRVTKQVAYAESTVRDAAGEIVSRGSATFLLRRRQPR